MTDKTLEMLGRRHNEGSPMASYILWKYYTEQGEIDKSLMKYANQAATISFNIKTEIIKKILQECMLYMSYGVRV